MGRLTMHKTRLAAGLASALTWAAPAAAQDASWLAAPPNSNFNDTANWTPTTVPIGTASFGTSTGTNITFANDTTLGGWIFNAGASNYSFTNNHSLIFAGAGIVVNGGSVSITSDNLLSFAYSSTAGSASITNNSVLEFFDTSTAGSASITNNGGLYFFSGSMAGSASITNNSVLQFSNTSTAGNASITNNGSLYFYSGSTAGSASITNNSLLEFFDTSTAGNASITNIGGLYFFSGSMAGSASITNNSVLEFFDTSTAGTANITNNGSGYFYSGSTAGSARITNNNLLQFFDTSTAGNASITNNSVLQFGSGSTAGSAIITNNNLLQFFDTSTAGNASITNNGGLYFYSGSTAGSSSITSDNLLRFVNSSTAGSARITNNSLLEFFDTSTAGTASITNIGGLYFFSGSTAGSASITNGAAGAVTDFSGSSGPVNNGQLSAGSIAGNGQFYLGANQLTVGGNNLSTIVSGVISDCGPSGSSCISGAFGGSLVKTGTGTLTLSGSNIYTGTTTVDAGTLNVTGSLAASSPVSVNTGAVLAGTGSVGSVSINSGGTLAPGDGTPGSSMNLGSLALQAGATYVVMLNPATTSSANVTGAATLGGATVKAIYANGSYISKQYTILTAGNVSGTFGSLVNTNLPANFTTRLSYDPTHAYLNLALNFVPEPARAFTSSNQRNVANALINSFNTAGGIPLVFGALTPAGLAQVSGEAATGSLQPTFDAMNLFLGILSDPFIAGRGNGATTNGAAPAYAEEGYDLSAYAPGDTPRSKNERDAYAAISHKAPAMADPLIPRWSVWAAGYGGSQTTDGNASLGSSTATSSVAGVAVGADYRISPFTTAGFAMAGGGTNFNVANGLGSGHSDLFQAGTFIRHTVGAAYLSGALAYGWQDVTTNRIVTISGADRLQARFSANAWSGRVEGGYRVVSPAMGGVGITPYAAGQFTTFDLPAYAESVLSGANTFAQAYNAKSVTDTRSELGVRTDKSYAVQDAILTLRGRLAWAHDFNPDRTVAATFQTLPGASFVVNGAAMASDAALVTGAAEMKWIGNWSVAATIESEFSNVTRSYAGKGTVRYAW
ncbi:autotransporter outer membrane beta-barrel domain-containing protein [Nitrobacter sp. JJSN]|uniref:autotransporter outer membrane beta-barrel domain-containing protein n=1 Tax=Nitrobacter sp. JJSN TaxID=3453033 RepID=UPI003F7583A3